MLARGQPDPKIRVASDRVSAPASVGVGPPREEREPNIKGDRVVGILIAIGLIGFALYTVFFSRLF